MINTVMLLGRVGKAPELKNFDSGNALCNFSLATSERYKDKTGEWREKTEWHNVSLWGKSGENFSNLVGKGDQVYISGKITYRQYEKDGQTRSVTEIVGNEWKRVSKSSPAQPQEPGKQGMAASRPQVTDDLPF